MSVSTRRWMIIGAVAVPLAAIIIYALVVVVGLPLLARRAIADWQAQTPGLQVGLREVSFNPWRWKLILQGFNASQAGQSLVRVDDLEVDVSIQSLLQRAIVLDQVSVQGVSLSLQWDAHGHLDIERIVPQQRRQRATKKEGPSLLWQIDHLAIKGVHIRVIDPTVGLSEPLELSLPALDLDHIGTLHRSDDKFSLDLHARYNEEAVCDLHWQGDVDFAPLSSTGHLQLANLSLPWLGQSLGQRWPVQLSQGHADFEADYSLAEAQGQQRLAVQNARLDVRRLDVIGKGRSAAEFSLHQLHAQAASIDSVRHQVTGEVLSLDTPELVLHRSEDGQIDLVALVRQLLESKSAPAAPAWAVSWPVAEMHAAAVRFDDRSSKGFGSWRLPGVDLRLENLQTIDDTPLRVAARGSGFASERGPVAVPWSVDGSLKPRSGALRLAWKARDLNLEQLNVLLARQGNLILQQGRLSAEGIVEGDVNHPAKLAAAGKVQVRQIEVLAADWGQWRGEVLDIGPVKWVAGHLQVDAVSAQTVHASQAQRVLDLDRISAADVAIYWDSPRVRLHQLQLSGLKWDDGESANPRLLGKQPQVTLQGLTWDGAKQRLRLHDVLFAKGVLSSQNAGKSVRVGWKRLELQEITGNLPAQRFTLGSVTADDCFLHGRQPWVKLPSLGLRGVWVDLRQRQLLLGAVSASGGQLLLLRREDGGIQPLTELRSTLISSSAPGPAAHPQVAAAASPAWQVGWQSLDIGLSSLQFDDHRRQFPPLTIGDVLLQSGAWSNSGTQALQGHLQLTFDGGLWQWDGTLSLQPLALDGQVAAQHVDLKLLQSWLAERTYARIDHCAVSTSGKLNLHADARGYRLHFEGGLQVGDARIVDQRNQQPVLAWTAMHVPQMVLDMPGGAQIPRIDLDGLYTKVSVEADHRLNWEGLVHPPPPSASAASAKKAGLLAGNEDGALRPEARPAALFASAKADETNVAKWPVHIDQVTLTQGSGDFADESLRIPFAATLQGLSGTMGPFASDAPQAWTNMKLKGRVREGGYVDVTGRIKPLAQPLRADAGLHFRDVELPTLNPYAAEFAGYRIDQGKLDLELQYKLDQGRIEGSNRARIDQIVLGPQVRKEGVPDLPLRLIIDILRNDDGVIDLDVPVEGDLNNPNVTLRDIAFKALESVLRNLMESPFRLVASLFGGGDVDTLRHIGFVPGAADLSAHDQTKLQNIAQVLSQHQKMELFIHPSYNPEVDASGQQPAPAAPAPTAPDSRASGGDQLRALALRRAEAIRAELNKSGIHNRRIFIDEPVSLSTLGKSGNVLTTLDLKVR